MTSIRRVQTERVLEDITRGLYATGTKPSMSDIFGLLSQYFSKYPAGSPLPIPSELAVTKQKSDVKKFNLALLHIAQNVDVLYETMLGQVDEVLVLTSSLQSHLARLRAKRNRIEAQIDDYLLSFYSTDGYFFSISDTFADLNFSDLLLTSANIDTTSGSVSIPSITSLTKRVDAGTISAPATSVIASNGTPLSFTEISSFRGAVEDSLTNTVWSFEANLDAQDVVTTRTVVSFNPYPQVSRIDFTPYGVTPVQIQIETLGPPVIGTSNVFQPFSNKIPVTTERVIFTGSLQEVSAIRITLTKVQPDYTTATTDGSTRYQYMFGAQDITFLEQAYDTQATFVSSRLTIPSDLTDDMVIDAVSVVVDDETPPGTELKYFVATDAGDTVVTEMSQLEWQPIQPLSTGVDTGTVLRFDGVRTVIKNIRSDAVSPDLQLIPLDTTATDSTLRNPTDALATGVDIYRICTFDDPVILNSLLLEEGVNTVKTSYVSGSSAEATNSLTFWASALSDPNTRITYGRIDAGNDFFYGGDIGESDVSAFVETFIECDTDRPTFLAQISKADLNSQQWDVRVFLNGREIGFLPAGGPTKMQLPWTLRQGANHVILLVSIPLGFSTGTINLMGESDLFDYGTVKLATWSYVDFFDLQHNTTGNPTIFSLVNGEIVSRRRPTDNLRLRYALSTGRGPSGLRVRADMTRQQNSPNVTPRLNSYRLRFAYGEGA